MYSCSLRNHTTRTWRSIICLSQSTTIQTFFSSLKSEMSVLPRRAFRYLLGCSSNSRLCWGWCWFVGTESSCSSPGGLHLKCRNPGCWAGLSTHLDLSPENLPFRFGFGSSMDPAADRSRTWICMFRSCALPQKQLSTSDQSGWAHPWSLWEIIRILGREGPSSGWETDEPEPAGWTRSPFISTSRNKTSTLQCSSSTFPCYVQEGT